MSQEEKLLLGEIIDNPAHQQPDGPTLRFCPTLFPAQAHLRRSALGDWDFFDGLVLALHFGPAHRQHVLGSAVLVAPGIALCARHVVESHVQEILDKKIDFICSGISRSGMMFWRVKEITLTRQTDVAILALTFASRFPKRNEFTLAAISTRLPREGELMTIAGFRASQDEFLSLPPTPNSIGGNILVATGEVRQLFEDRRDYMLPGPTVVLDCANLGGMSGGPAFDERGMLVGVLGVGEDASENAVGIAYVSLIWPALAMQIQPTWPPGYWDGRSVSLLNIDNEFCHIERRDAVSAELDPLTGTTKLTYEKW